jgi:hypothetical protein
MDELQEVRNSLALEMQDCHNQGDRQTALTIQRVCNAIDRVIDTLAARQQADMGEED